MTREEYINLDAVALAALIAGGEVSAAEALEAALARLAEVNPKLNAVTQDLSERARALVADGAPAGPLGGVPFLLKDLGPALAGTPTTSSCWLYKDDIATADSPLAAFYQRAGLVIFGKTNTPELGLEPITEPAMFGPTRNPWDLARTSGGSSGGAAAATAAGVVAAAHASDGGGSIRIPASACGLFGLKPSRGRVSYAPKDEGWGGFSTGHAVTRTVRDSAVLLDIACQPQPGDPYWLDPPARPFAEEVGRDPGALRIGFTTAAMASDRLDPECAQAVLDAARLCESLGHRVEEISMPASLRGAIAAAGVVVSCSVAADLDAVAERRGRPIGEDEIEPITFSSYQRGRGIDASSYLRALRLTRAFGRDMAALFEGCDVLVTSTLGSPAIPIGALHGEPLDLHGYSRRLFAFMPNTQAFNLSGQPAMSVPLAWSSGGLPIGVQFAARQAGEGVLLRLAAQLEQARPWIGRRPPL
ncbi:MAG TPA: amidase [Caulobacteraceae bacterium]|nr:amidase [Caulobacteraceae bacterium]